MQQKKVQSHCRIRGSAPRRSGRQRGAVLVVGLVMLTVMTMLVVSMLRTSIVDLKIGGVSQDAAINFNNAEVALDSFFNQNTGTFSNNCTVLAPKCTTWVPPTYTTPSQTPIAPVPTQMYCGDKPGFNGNQVGSGYQTVVIDVAALATTVLGNQTRLHLGIAQDLPPGACSV